MVEVVVIDLILVGVMAESVIEALVIDLIVVVAVIGVQARELTSVVQRCFPVVLKRHVMVAQDVSKYSQLNQLAMAREEVVAVVF